jgi:hypothetical protein
MSYDHYAIDDHVARNEQVQIRADNVSFTISELLKEGKGRRRGKGKEKGKRKEEEEK